MNQYAIQDANRFPAITGHSGTANNAEVRRIVVDDEGNLNVVIQETNPLHPSNTNPSYTVTRTYVAPTYTTVIQKVIAGTTYTKTIVKNTSTNVETISAWS